MSDENVMKRLYMTLDLPDGWTCISCGDEYLEDTTGKDVANYDEGTLCLKCEQESEDET